MNHLAKVLRTWVAFAVVILIFGMFTYAAVQQDLRQSANDPQIQMAEDTAVTINQGSTAQTLVSGSIDIANSLAPFLIIYDKSGKVLASSAQLGGKTPALPSGVLTATTSGTENRVTWEPQNGVRIAAVVVPTKTGYVLAGRSLREVEKREDKLGVMTGLALFSSLVLVLFILAVSL